MYLISQLIKLMRPQQWYKNLLVFAAAFFSGSLLSFPALILSFYGFIALCLVSSGNYIANDIIDRNRDRLNPEKRRRPVASGAVSVSTGGLFAVGLYGLGFFISYLLGSFFLLVSLSLAVSGLAYSALLKNIVFLDIITIGVNFVLRAIAGVVLFGVALSPWFFLAIFFFAFFLIFGKRLGDIELMGKDAKKYKPVLQYYDKHLLKGLMQSFLSCLIILYGLYSFFTERLALLFLYPVLIYVLFRYYYLVCMGSRIARDPEKVFIYDRPILLASVIFAIGLFIAIYLI